jgi:transcriptional regulator with XRE-family HTH domain
MPENNVFLDPSTVGRRIREIRKNKDLTIIELAEKLGFATGKLSNIEKGRRLKLPFEELQQIADALEEPVESFLDADPETMFSNIETIKEKISMASHRLSSGLVKNLSENLDELENDISRYSFKGLEIYIYFLWAEYFKIHNEQEESIQYYKLAIVADISDQETFDLKIRSYNGLATLLFNQNNLREAITVLRHAINFIGKTEFMLNLDVSNVHYNLTILYLHKGYLDLAESHIKDCLDITEERNEQAYFHAMFLLAITYLKKNEFDKAKVYLFESIKWFQRQKDRLSLLRSLGLIFLMYRLHPGLFLSGIFKIVDAQDFLELEVQESEVPEKIKCGHCLIEVALYDKDYLFAKELIERCKSFAAGINRNKISYKTFALEAKLLRETNGSIKMQKVALESALSYFDENDHSNEKAALCFHLGRLTENSGGPLLNNSLELFYGNYIAELNHEECIRAALPALRY